MTPAIPAIRRRSILVVESVEIRSFLSFLLTRPGLDVLEAEPECGGQMLADHLEDVELIIANRPERFVASGIPIIYIAAIPDAEMRSIAPKCFRSRSVQPKCYFTSNASGSRKSRSMLSASRKISWPRSDRSTANPFYRYLTPEKFPGPLRNQANVTVGSLLVPYPQYGSLTQSHTNGVLDRYHSLQLKVQRPFSRGFSLLAGYSYKREKSSVFFNAIDQYANQFTFQNVGPTASSNATASPTLRHRFNAAGTYELPFGKGRPYMSNIPRFVDAVLGGWRLSAEVFMNSGNYLQFGQMIANGNPVISNPTRDKWFDTSVFQRSLAYTPRTNPWFYDGLTGPGSFNIDSTLGKSFQLTERFKLELRLEAYNATNSVMWASPSLDVNSSLFGRITSQANTCREIQYAAKITF